MGVLDSLPAGSSREASVFGATVSLAALAVLVVSLRFVSRGFILKKLFVEDWFILLALFLSVCLSAAICVGTRYGLGRHSHQMPEEWLTPAQKARFAYTILYNPTLMACKTSILASYCRILYSNRLLNWITWVTIFVVNATGIVLTALFIFQCNPVSAAFSGPLRPPEKCVDRMETLYTSAPVSIVTDLVILFIPMTLLKSLYMPQRQKIILSLIFATGLFACVVGIVKTFYFQKAAESTDFSWNGSLAFMWASIEVNVGIICASFPTLKPLVARFLPGFLEARVKKVVSSHGLVHLPHAQNVDIYSTSTRFIDIPQPRPALSLTSKQSLKPASLVTILFFLWGFSFGLIKSLSTEVKKEWSISETTVLITYGCYFGAYFFSPILFSRFILKKYGFKATFMAGLFIFGFSCLGFWPSAATGSHVGIYICMFIGGFGLAALETAANPFIALCGPSKYMEVRLNFAQGFQSIGALCAATLVTKVICVKPDDPERGKFYVQWAYVGAALFVTFLAMGIYYFDVPEISDCDFDFDPPTPESSSKSLWNSNLNLGLIWAMLAMFFYIGAQQTIYTFAESLLQEKTKSTPPAATATPHSHPHSLLPSNTFSTGQGLSAAGRFISSFIMLAIRPRWVLLFFLSGAFVASALAMCYTGDFVIAMIVLVFFFESTCFPTIFALSIRRLGKHTKDASAYLISACCGGALIPPVFFAIAAAAAAEKGQTNTTTTTTTSSSSSSTTGAGDAMCVVVVAFAAAVTYPVYLNLSRRERRRCRRVD